MVQMNGQEPQPLDVQLQAIADAHRIDAMHLDSRAASLQGKLRGLISRPSAARLIVAKMSLRAGLENYLGEHSRHVSGTDLSDAMAVAHQEAANGRRVSVGYWSQPSDRPAAIAADYAKAIDAIAQTLPGASISIKADQLEFDRALLFPVFRRAAERKVPVHFDSQHFDTATRAMAMLEAARDLGAEVSASLSSRWRRSVQDAERLMALKVGIRIVKGQGGDPTDPEIDPRQSFAALVAQCAGRASHVGVATHDPRVAGPALDVLKAAGTPCALEQLVSLPRLDALAARRGIPVQVYVAYGRFGLPYALSEVTRRPAIAGWILRDLAGRLLGSRSS